MNSTVARGFLLVILSMAGLSSALGAGFSFQPLGFGAIDSVASDVSGDGTTVVGLRVASDGFNGFRWTVQSGMESVFPGLADAVSDDGSVVAGHSAYYPRVPVRWTEQGGEEYILGTSPVFYSVVRQIQDDGSIWGVVYEDGPIISYVWSPTTGSTVLPPPDGYPFWGVSDVSDDKVTVIGNARDGEGNLTPVRISGGIPLTEFGVLPGERRPELFDAVTADGQVIVGRTVDEAIRWQESTGLVGLGDLPGGRYYSEARDVSADGRTIVGMSESITSLFGSTAFLWNAAAGMLSIPELLGRQGVNEFSNWDWSLATAISDDGRTIVGYGGNPNGDREAWVVTLPKSGDATFDNIIDGADYVAWADHFLETDTNWSQGDFNFDGKTDAVDYVIWADHFAPGQAVSISIVPEPSPQHLTLIAAALVAIVRVLSYRSNRAAK